MTEQYITEIQSGLSPKNRLNQIVEHAMCIGCGICQSMAGENRINMGCSGCSDQELVRIKIQRH